MDIIESSIEVVSASPEWSRSPLSSVTNSPPRAPTPLQHKKIRRISSVICRITSSEDVPSPHELELQAEFFSNTNSEDYDSGLPSKVCLSTAITPTTYVNFAGSNNDVLDQVLAPEIGSTAILYGHGTSLRTIIEQNSCTTMNTKLSSGHTRSNSEVLLARTPVPNLLGHRNSFDLPSTVTLRSPHRRKSFTANDLNFIKRSYHEACTLIERRSGNSPQLSLINTKSRTPISYSIKRPWTAAQNTAQLQHWSPERFSNRLQRLLRTRAIQTDLSSQQPVLTTPQQMNGDGRSSSNQLPGKAPYFSHIRSGHGNGPLNSHPFPRAGRTDVKGDDVSGISQPRMQNVPLPHHSDIAQGALKTASRGIRKGKRGPRGIFGQQISISDALASNSVKIGHNEVSQQCPHRGGRQAFLRNQSPKVDVIVPNLNHSAAKYTPLASKEPQGDPILKQTPPINLSELHAIGSNQANALLVLSPITIDALTFPLAPASPFIKHHTHRCWKCRVLEFVTKLDDIWGLTTTWCCWMFCGVDLNDDAESQYTDNGNGALRGYAQGSLGPRRVLVDGIPSMLS